MLHVTLQLSDSVALSFWVKADVINMVIIIISQQPDIALCSCKQLVLLPSDYTKVFAAVPPDNKAASFLTL